LYEENGIPEGFSLSENFCNVNEFVVNLNPFKRYIVAGTVSDRKVSIKSWRIRTLTDLRNRYVP